MTLKQALSFSIAALVLAALAFIALVQPHFAKADFNTGTVLSVATTSASFNVTSSTRILATTTSVAYPSYTRVYATICTASSNPVYLNLDADKPAAQGAVTTIIAAAAGYSACYEITDRNMYQGSIQASSTNQTSTVVNVKDYVHQP